MTDNMNANNDNVASSNNVASSQPAQNTQQQPQAMQAPVSNTMPQQAKAVVGIFNTLSAAEQAVTQLRSNGFNTEEINIVSKDTSATSSTNKGDDTIMDGTMTGGAIGGIGGLLLSAGALTIPGLGSIIAAGPIAATIAGAIGGGVTGGLIDWGIPSDKSEEYNDQISSGNTLAVIKTPESKVAQAVQILTSGGATNIETHNAK